MESWIRWLHDLHQATGAIAKAGGTADLPLEEMIETIETVLKEMKDAKRNRSLYGPRNHLRKARRPANKNHKK